MVNANAVMAGFEIFTRLSNIFFTWTDHKLRQRLQLELLSLILQVVGDLRQDVNHGSSQQNPPTKA